MERDNKWHSLEFLDPAMPRAINPGMGLLNNESLFCFLQV